MKGFFAAILIGSIFCGGAFPQVRRSIDPAITAKINLRDYSGAIAELNARKAADPTAFSAGNYAHILARVAEADGMTATAMSAYQQSASTASMRQMSQIARSTGNLLFERLLLTEISIEHSNDPSSAMIERRLAENRFESGNYAETIRMLTTKRSGSMKTDAIGARDAQVLLGESYLRMQAADQARSIFSALINNMPNPAQPDDAALKAAKGLDILDGGASNAELSEAEHRLRAGIYQFNRDYKDARLHFEKIISRFPDGAADALLQIGRGYTQADDHVEAIKWYERVLEQYPESAIAKDALLQTASAYARVGKQKEAITRYQKFIEKYPTDEKVERAFLNIVDIHRDQSEDQEALKWCLKVEERFKGAAPEAVAIFTEARIHLAREDWSSAIAALERVRFMPDLGGNSPGGTNVSEINFLKALTLEQLGRYSEAVDTYLSIPDGRGEYYGWRATERLRGLLSNDAARSHVLQKVGELSAGLQAKDANTRRVNAQSIMRIDPDSPSAEKALSVLRAAIRDIPAYSAFATMPKSDDVPSNSLLRSIEDDLNGTNETNTLAAAESAWKKVPADFPVDLIPREQLRELYPVVYDDSLVRYATARKVDPRFVLAVMRQESRFRPDARSNAAARGLMQFIAPTASQVASELGRKNFHSQELYHGPTSVLFGSQYLADIFKVFPEQPPAVAASYNGGQENMKRWLARSRSSSPDRYIPEIMFAQSKDYVYKVMANYRMYQMLYDEQLRTR